MAVCLVFTTKRFSMVEGHIRRIYYWLCTNSSTWAGITWDRTIMIYSSISAHLCCNRGLQDREKSLTNFVSCLLHFQFLTRPASVTSLINAHSGLKSWHPIVSGWFPLIVVINVPTRKSGSEENMLNQVHLATNKATCSNWAILASTCYSVSIQGLQ